MASSRSSVEAKYLQADVSHTRLKATHHLVLSPPASTTKWRRDSFPFLRQQRVIRSGRGTASRVQQKFQRLLGIPGAGRATCTPSEGRNAP